MQQKRANPPAPTLPAQRNASQPSAAQNTARETPPVKVETKFVPPEEPVVSEVLSSDSEDMDNDDSMFS